jgi:hypothetical protein
LDLTPAAWTGRLKYGNHHAEAIERDVLCVYGEMAVAKVAHSEHLKSILPTPVVGGDLRSEAALMAPLGLSAKKL